MTEKTRIPGQVDVPTRFFAAFTVKDIIRLGLPILVGGNRVIGGTVNRAALSSLGIGILLGITWYTWRPYDQPVDTHLYHLLRWMTQKRQLTGSIPEFNGDHLVAEDGTVIGVIEVSPTNLETKTDAERHALQSVLQNLYQSVTYPLTVHSRQQQLDLQTYIEHVENQDTGHELLEKDYTDYCQRLTDSLLTATRHYIIVKVEPRSLHWLQQTLEKAADHLPRINPVDSETRGTEAAADELDSRCRDIIDTLDTADLTIERVENRRLDNLTDRFQHSAPNLGVTWTDRPDSNDFGEYRKSVFLTEYPAGLSLGWTLSLLRTTGQVDITQSVRPRNPSTTTKKLRRLSEKLSAEIDSYLRQGYRGTNKLETLLEDIEWMLDLLADRQDQPVDYGVCIIVHSDDPDRCRTGFQQVCNRLQTMQIDYQLPIFRTDHSHSTDQPLRPCRGEETLLMPAGSAAAGFPFATQDTDQNQGVVYGVDTSDETPILLDRYTWSSHSMARMGMVGSGKSYATKIELLRSHLAYNDLQIYVVDPKQEYKSLVRSLDGRIYTLGEDSQLGFKTGDVIGYQVAERGQEENVDRLVDTVRQIYDFASRNSRKTLVVIDEARILLNDEEGRRVLNQFVLEARDTNTAITLISQNASHFTHCREGREILDNMPGKIFMRHDRVPESVVEYFDLSHREKQELYELKTGTDSPYSEALLRVSGRLKTRVRIESTSQEHAIIQAGEHG